MRPLAAALVLLAVTACGGGGSAELPEGAEEIPLAVQPGDGPDEDMEALVGGTVGLDEATGCVVFVRDGGSEPVVWPAGTRASRDPFVVVLADGRTIEEGDYVEGSGGVYDLPENEGMVARFGAPEACLAGASEVPVFNSHDDLRIGESSDAIERPGQPVEVPQSSASDAVTGQTSWLEGTVEFQPETGCGVLVADGIRYAVVWPWKTRGKANPYRLTLADGTVVHDGDAIRGRGVFFTPDSLEALGGAGSECIYDPDARKLHEQAWAFNQDETLEVVER